jgi:hypothetical protein
MHLEISIAIKIHENLQDRLKIQTCIMEWLHQAHIVRMHLACSTGPLQPFFNLCACIHNNVIQSDFAVTGFNCILGTA